MIARKTRFLTLLLLLAFGLVHSVEPCDSKIKPNCGRSVWLAKAVSKTVVHPGDFTNIYVDLNLLPFATWNLNPLCAQPISASLMVSLICESDGGGPALTVGPLAVPVDVPSVPGLQPLLTGPGATPELGGPYEFCIPAGTLPAGNNYTCTVVGDYTVTFGVGIGSGPLTGTGDTEVCIVEPSLSDPSVPRLGFCRIDEGPEFFLGCRSGDEGVARFLVTNNDLLNGVRLGFSSWSNQVARLPSGPDPDHTTFAISSNKRDRDNFPLRFTDLFDVGVFVPEGNPMKKSKQLIERQLYLGPGEMGIVPITVRSHGMCSDGSCSEVFTRLQGRFDDGDPALGCASTALVVLDVPAKLPLYEVTDSLAVSALTDALFSPAVFDGSEHHVTMRPGNLKQGMQLTGAGLPSSDLFPQTAFDRQRSEQLFNEVKYKLEGFPAAENFLRQKNSVRIRGFSDGPGTLRIPLLKKNLQPSNFQLTIFAESGNARLLDLNKQSNQRIFDGSLVDLLTTPPPGVFIDPGTYREFELIWPAVGPLLGVCPYQYAGTFDAAGPAADLPLRVFDPLTDTDLPWTASSDTSGVTLDSSSGTAGQNALAQFQLGNLPLFPNFLLTWLTFNAVGAFNNPFLVPIIARKLVGLGSVGALVINEFTARIFFNKNNRDRLSIFGTVPIVQGFQPKGQVVAIRVGYLTVNFILDKHGRSTGSTKHQSFKLDLERQNGVVQGGVRPFEMRLRKLDLSGLFSHHGVRREKASEIPFLGEIPIVAHMFRSEHVASKNQELLIFVTPVMANIEEN